MSSAPASREEYGLPQDETECATLGRILSQCFGRPAATPVEIKADDPLKRIRVLREKGRVVGGLWLIPMGQWFGGRSVSMTGVAAVGTDPERRGKGSAQRLMACAMEELRAEGIALSGLYPATQSLYRKAGYEQGGTRMLIQLPPARIGVKERGASLRAVTVEDRPALAEAHRAWGRLRNGHIDRGAYIWNRVYEHKGEPARGYVVEEKGQVTGYVFYIQRPATDGYYELWLTDVVALTAVAARRILGFLADHGSMVPTVEWAGHPSDPLLVALPEQPYKMKLHTVWMTRIVSVPVALEARGYPHQAAARLEIAVRDDIVPANTGSYILEVAQGCGRVRPGGSGALTLDIRGLAALYTGFLSPYDLHLAGLLEGAEPALRTAGELFAGATPWMSDFF